MARFTYAGRHPELFKAAASYSGALDLREEADQLPAEAAERIWGDQIADSANWDAHDPVKLIPELRGKDLFISWGSGEPGPLDPPGSDQDRIETRINLGNERFVEELEAAGIPVTVEFLRPGDPFLGLLGPRAAPLPTAAAGVAPAARSAVGEPVGGPSQGGDRPIVGRARATPATR